MPKTILNMQRRVLLGTTEDYQSIGTFFGIHPGCDGCPPSDTTSATRLETDRGSHLQKSFLQLVTYRNIFRLQNAVFLPGMSVDSGRAFRGLSSVKCIAGARQKPGKSF